MLFTKKIELFLVLMLRLLLRTSTCAKLSFYAKLMSLTS